MPPFATRRHRPRRTSLSDWGATHSTVAAANAGLSQQMPDDSYFGAPLKAAVLAGQVTNETLDTMVTRVLTPLFATGVMANP